MDGCTKGSRVHISHLFIYCEGMLPMMWTACLVCSAMSEVDVLPMCACRCSCAKVILCTMHIQCALIIGQVLHI